MGSDRWELLLSFCGLLPEKEEKRPRCGDRVYIGADRKKLVCRRLKGHMALHGNETHTWDERCAWARPQRKVG